MPGAAASMFELGLALEEVAGEGWRAEQVQVETEVDARGRSHWVIHVQGLHLQGLEQPLRGLRVDCAAGTLGMGGLRCEAVRLRMELAGLGVVQGRGRLRWARDGAGELVLDEGRAAGGHFSLVLSKGDHGGWTLKGDGSALEVARVLALVPGLQGSAGGRLGFRAQVSRGRHGTMEVAADFTASGLRFSEPEGLRELEGVGVSGQVYAKTTGEAWRGGLRLRVDAGQVYWDPWYLEPGRRAVEFEATGRWEPVSGALRLSRFRYRDAGAVEAEGSARLGTSSAFELRHLSLRRLTGRLPQLYETYLRPPLIGTILDDLETTGGLSARLELDGVSVRSLQLEARDVSVRDRGGRFSLLGLEGRLAWGQGEPARSSTVRVEGGSFYRLASGPFELDLVQRGRGLALAGPVQVPLFDGRLDVDRFELKDLLDPMAGWAFDAVLTPVSMLELTRALQWPEMDGTLSGVIPDVVYESGVLRVGGALLVRLFDGAVVVDRLTLEAPFGVVPILEADVSVRDIDLDLLTRRFPFGRITGRVGGHVRGLVLESWSPVRFDAWLGTPPGDRSRHRISQRAVENLSSLGGGPSAALSAGFMRIFEEFPYDRLGLGCRLDNGLCTMRGVEPAEGGGYYIVKGRGLPRIDVIGYREQVDWERLVERLMNLSLDTSPVVE